MERAHENNQRASVVRAYSIHSSFVSERKALREHLRREGSDYYHCVRTPSSANTFRARRRWFGASLSNVCRWCRLTQATARRKSAHNDARNSRPAGSVASIVSRRNFHAFSMPVQTGGILRVLLHESDTCLPELGHRLLTCYTDHPLRKQKERGRTRDSGRPSKADFVWPASLGASIGGLFTILVLFLSSVGGWMQLQWTARVSR